MVSCCAGWAHRKLPPHQAAGLSAQIHRISLGVDLENDVAIPQDGPGSPGPTERWWESEPAPALVQEICPQSFEEAAGCVAIPGFIKRSIKGNRHYTGLDRPAK